MGGSRKSEREPGELELTRRELMGEAVREVGDLQTIEEPVGDGVGAGRTGSGRAPRHCHESELLFDCEVTCQRRQTEHSGDCAAEGG